MVVVDEEIYEHPPTFVVGTIDKFALIPWAPQLSALFGRGSDNVAPDLIIQDELHLISDSLGSLAGLYETVVDIVCGEVSAPPKIVGSTATIRRAQHISGVSPSPSKIRLHGVSHQDPASGTFFEGLNRSYWRATMTARLIRKTNQIHGALDFLTGGSGFSSKPQNRQ